MKRLALSLSMLLILALRGEAQVMLKAIERPNYNVLLFLQTEPGDAGQEVEVGFRPENRKAFFRQDRFLLPDSPAPFFLQKYKLPPNTYELAVSLKGTDPRQHQLTFESLASEKATRLSDVFLSSQAIASPESCHLIDENQRIHADEVHFWVETYSRVHRQLTARAVLYQQEAQQQENPAVVFSSLQRISRVLSMQNGRAVLQGTFATAELSGGNYLVEILIFEDDQLLAEQSASFRLNWREREQMLAEPGRALRMMSLLFSPSQQDSLLNLPSPEARKQALLSWWQQHHGEAAETEMEVFFKKALAAEQKFKEDGPFWENERAQAELLYGPAQREQIKRKSQLWERWFYPEWNVNLWFKKVGKHWVQEK
jgi:GWxTD domain-containing protein